MSKPSLRERIVDTALDLAERSSWETVRLHQVAVTLGIALDDVRAHFREKEDIVDAWFDRADAAMLREAARIEVAALPMRARLHPHAHGLACGIGNAPAPDAPDDRQQA